MSGDLHSQTYIEETRDLLFEMEISLIELEDRPEDMEIVNKIFRYIHTIKGSGAMFGFDEIVAFSHEIETVFDLVREGKIPVTDELISLSLSAKDEIHDMIESGCKGFTGYNEKREKILSSFHEIAGLAQTVDEKTSVAFPEAEEKVLKILRIRFHPPENLFLSGTNPLHLLEELKELGDCKITAYTDLIPSLSDYVPEYCYTYWDIVLTTIEAVQRVQDVFIFVEDIADVKIDIIGREDYLQDKRIGEILLDRGDLNSKDLEKALAAQNLIGEILTEKGIVKNRQIEAALKEQQAVREVQNKPKADEVTNIKVSSDRLDKLVDLVSEIVIIQARLNQTAYRKGDIEMIGIAEEMERLVTELRGNALNIRMVPIGTIFTKFKRLVRDLSAELGKEVEIITDGAETELDKTVIDKLNEPLVHLIRNCIDHGIETPSVREMSGKARQGKILLSAFNSGANVLIQIKDDGKGLDKDVIYGKAFEKGLVSSDVQLSEKEIFSLIFEPGFSTAKEVTNISGRGVGMDVVKRFIDGLGGSIDISSEINRGTTITLKLPLTLAIIEGLLSNIGDSYFVFPLSLVEESIVLKNGEARQRNILNVRGEIIPYFYLKHIFNIPSEEKLQQAVIINLDGHKLGFVVDRIIGEHQTVIKNLGRFYRDVKGFSGATILGDGNVAIILDVPELVRRVTNLRGDGI